MPKQKVGYEMLSLQNKALVRRLVSPRATAKDWDEFYTTIRCIVTKRYAKVLQNTAEHLSVDDFMRGPLTNFLREDKCRRLLQFLNLKSENSDCQHLFGTWFRNVLKSAMSIAAPLKERAVQSGDAPKKGKKGSRIGSVIDNAQSGQTAKPVSKMDDASFAKLLRSMDAARFSTLLEMIWKEYPQRGYALVMSSRLKFPHGKIADFIGREEASLKTDKDRARAANAIARKLQLAKEQITSMFEKRAVRQNAYYGADGEADVDLVEQLGAALGTLCFRCERRRGDTPPCQWILELKMPFEVSDKALIRGVLSDGNGGVPQGTLFCYGKNRKIRANGHFEFPVSEFKKFSNSSEIHFTTIDGERSDGVPFVPDESDGLSPTIDLLVSWACRRMPDSDPVELTADLLDDFGYVLPQLLLKDEALATLPFEKFGVPRIDRKHLRREYNEAFVLFRAELSVDSDSPLSPDGFMLPLEWRFNPYAANLPSNLLPLHLSSLARRVAGEMHGALRTTRPTNATRRDEVIAPQDEEPCKWQLQPSMRFFDDRVDFSALGLLGGNETDVASAIGALAVAFTYADSEVKYHGWPFSSIKYDFAEGRPQGVGGIAQKMAVTESFGGKELFVSPDQQGLSEGKTPVAIKKVAETSLAAVAEEVAFDHLAKLRPSTPVQFKTVSEELLSKRTNLITHAKSRDGKVRDGLFSFANKKDVLETSGTFVVLLGGPGMGKSVLMGLLHERCTLANKAIGYVCQAGRANQGWEFVKSLAHGLASTYGEITDELLSVKLPGSPPNGEVLKDYYENLVLKPIRKIIGRRKDEKLFVLVDGLDEDANGEVVELLLDEKLRFPPKVGVVVSSRHIVQDEDRLLARAKGFVIDLDRQDTEYAIDIRMDVRTYIDQWTCMNEAVYCRLLESEIDSELLKDAIQEKDRSFLYAYHVLSGIAGGQYRIGSIEELQKDLPSDLKACFYDAFKARFPDAEAYGRVKPLLRLLVRKGRVSEVEAGCKTIVGEESLGSILKALRGYAVESGGEISLSSEAVRMWLKDATHNAEFGV